MKCFHCEEEILPGERAACMGLDLHYECFMRSIIGSVAHLKKLCPCYGGSAAHLDPPMMTRREAARAALALWQSMQPEISFAA